ncbi:MAG: FAD-binding oxidoreductase [Candidatus Binatia bacterium]|nr:FAD-binding oxidoreductase [Candidatus Binatia bacterium]
MAKQELFRELVARLPADALSADSAFRHRFALGGRVPEVVVVPNSEEEVVGALQVCAELGAAVVPWGEGARQQQMPAPWRYDVALAMGRMNRVLAYEPDDLTVTVQAGCTLETLARLLAPRRQWLLNDIALPAQSTVGGVVASAVVALTHCARLSARDLLLGITFASGEGALVHAGGRVVKNVAGYDLMRLLTGSWGTLGVVTQATWKVLPQPLASATWWVECSSLSEALDRAGACAADLPEPTRLAVLQLAGGQLDNGGIGVLVGYAGAPEEVESARARLSTCIGYALPVVTEAPAQKMLRAVRDFPLVPPRGRWTAGLRLALPPGAALAVVGGAAAELEQAGASVCTLPQRGTVYLRFDQNYERGVARLSLVLGEICTSARGWLVPDIWPAGAQWSAPELPHLFLSRRVKETLDPRGVLSPGRYWGHW